MAEGHERIETNIGLMVVLVLIVSSFGGLVTILPLFSQSNLLRPVDGIEPYPALQLAGRDLYVREGCYVCHSQMIRPFRAETERYGHYSVAGEFVYDRPFQWGSRRAGLDSQMIDRGAGRRVDGSAVGDRSRRASNSAGARHHLLQRNAACDGPSAPRSDPDWFLATMFRALL